MIFVLFLANTAFTAVTAYILAASGEFVDSQTAVIGTSTAIGHRSCVFQFIDPNQIESMTVLKGQQAVDKYGDRAKDGALVLQLKK